MQLRKCSCILLSVIFAAVCGEQTPPGWEPDPAFSNFLQLSLQNMKRILKNGDRSLGVPPMDPFNIPTAKLNHDKRNAKVTGTFDNLVLQGLSDIQFTRVQGGFRPPLLDLQIYFPRLTVTGNYNVKGTVASIFPLYGNGPCTLTIIGLRISGVARLNIENDRFQVETLKLDGDLENLIVNFENFMGGGDFGRVLNNVLKMVAKRLFETKVKPQVIKKQEEALKKNLNRILQEGNYGGVLGVINDSQER